MKSNIVKIFSLILSMSVLLSLCACKGKTETNITVGSTSEKVTSESKETDTQKIEIDQLEDMDGGETVNLDEDF